MITRSNLMGLLAVLAGIYIFKATTYVPQVENLIKQYPIPTIGLMCIIFFSRGKIADRLGLK